MQDLMSQAPERVVWQPPTSINRLQWLVKIRLSMLLAALFLAILAAWRIPGLPVGPLLISVLILLGSNTILWFFLRSGIVAQLSESSQNWLVHGQIVLDLVGLTAICHLAGGAENPFFPFYAFPVILASAWLTARTTWGYAGLASLLYGMLLLGEASGVLPHYTLTGLLGHSTGITSAFLGVQWAALTATCFLAGGAANVLIVTLHNQAKALAASQQRAEARASHMRELNARLLATSDECGHRREHLDAAYAELQQAYERLQTRSIHMSELNEQLRAANAECKQRRVELAEVNAKLQEAYGRIETRTTHMSELNEQLRAANAECKARREELERLNTQLATANTKLRELEDVRAQFTLLVTHELRAPVAAIQSYLKLILDGYVPESKLRETLIKAERRAMDQLALIADLLELGRVGSADARGHVQSIHIEQSLREQVDLLAAGAHERNITIQADIEADLPAVMANPDQIKSLWNNLISNAIKYNRDGGQVTIILKREDERLVASVADTGIGIPTEVMPRLFREFFRADNAKAHSRMGTGLGLSIVKEIVERTGGQISAESEINKGTIFHFWLPIIKAEA